MYTRPRDQKRREVETPVTLWVPNDLLAILDNQLARQQATVATVPGARITRHAYLITELRRLLTSSQPSAPETINP